MSFSDRLRPVFSLRIGEIFLMSGFFTIGIFFAPVDFRGSLPRIMAATAGIMAYILSVYTLNSYADYHVDQVNPRLAHLNRIGKNTYLALSVASVVIFCSIFGWLNMLLIPLSLLSYTTWIFYYVMGFKGRPYFGTAIHFIAGILHFHFGYCALLDLSLQSLSGSMFFALVLSAGHVNHEILDYAADSRAAVITTAVKIGIQKAHRNLLLLFSASCVYGLGFYSVFHKTYPAFFLFPLASLISVITGLIAPDKWGAQGFKIFYRSLFALAGIAFCASTVSLRISGF